MRDELNEETIESLLSRIGDRLGYDYNKETKFPETRKDVCVAIWTTENGHTYGYDTAYLIWTDGTAVQNKIIIDTKQSKDYVNIESIAETKRQIIVNLYTRGSMSGTPWEKEFRYPKHNLKLKD